MTSKPSGKGPWSIEEDDKLQQWVDENGAQKWSLCSDTIPGRSGKQCRERWFNNLNPDVKKGNWTAEEDDMIFQGYLSFGSSWSRIAKNLEGRTENSVKNRFYSTVRKLLSDSGKKEGQSSEQQIRNIIEQTLGKKVGQDGHQNSLQQASTSNDLVAHDDENHALVSSKENNPDQINVNEENGTGARKNSHHNHMNNEDDDNDGDEEEDDGENSEGDDDEGNIEGEGDDDEKDGSNGNIELNGGLIKKRKYNRKRYQEEYSESNLLYRLLKSNDVTIKNTKCLQDYSVFYRKYKQNKYIQKKKLKRDDSDIDPTNLATGTEGTPSLPPQQQHSEQERSQQNPAQQEGTYYDEESIKQEECFNTAEDIARDRCDSNQKQDSGAASITMKKRVKLAQKAAMKQLVNSKDKVHQSAAATLALQQTTPQQVSSKTKTKSAPVPVSFEATSGHDLDKESCKSSEISSFEEAGTTKKEEQDESRSYYDNTNNRIDSNNLVENDNNNDDDDDDDDGNSGNDDGDQLDDLGSIESELMEYFQKSMGQFLKKFMKKNKSKKLQAKMSAKPSNNSNSTSGAQKHSATTMASKGHDSTFSSQQMQSLLSDQIKVELSKSMKSKAAPGTVLHQSKSSQKVAAAQGNMHSNAAQRETMIIQNPPGIPFVQAKSITSKKAATSLVMQQEQQLLQSAATRKENSSTPQLHPQAVSSAKLSKQSFEGDRKDYKARLQQQQQQLDTQKQSLLQQQHQHHTSLQGQNNQVIIATPSSSSGVGSSSNFQSTKSSFQLNKNSAATSSHPSNGNNGHVIGRGTNNQIGSSSSLFSQPSSSNNNNNTNGTTSRHPPNSTNPLNGNIDVSSLSIQNLKDLMNSNMIGSTSNNGSNHQTQHAANHSNGTNTNTLKSGTNNSSSIAGVDPVDGSSKMNTQAVDQKMLFLLNQLNTLESMLSNTKLELVKLEASLQHQPKSNEISSLQQQQQQQQQQQLQSHNLSVKRENSNGIFSGYYPSSMQNLLAVPQTFNMIASLPSFGSRLNFDQRSENGNGNPPLSQQQQQQQLQLQQQSQQQQPNAQSQQQTQTQIQQQQLQQQLLRQISSKDNLSQYSDFEKFLNPGP